jgi:hypothetical protein
MRILLAIVILFFASCCTRKPPTVTVTRPTSAKALPAIIIYKTKANYSMLVPVGLSADKKEIVSYPDPKDVKDDSGFYYPTALKNGYWMDNIGVGINTGYLGMSLKEYSQLKEPLSLAEMMAMLVDLNPFTEMWNCGNRESVSVDELNIWIKNNELSENCKKIKQ